MAHILFQYALIVKKTVFGCHDRLLVLGDWRTVSSFLKLASQYIFEMNSIECQQKGTANKKKKLALDIVTSDAIG